MLIDCETCTVRGDACADCVVTFLTIPVRQGAGPPGPSGPSITAPVSRSVQDLDDAERQAIGVLADAGLVPPLRMEPAV